MTGMSKTQLLQYLEKNKLIKHIEGVYHLTDKLTALTKPSGSPKEALSAFCDEVGMPFQVPGPTGKKYTIKYVNDRIGKVYLQVLSQVDREELVEVTKKYYKETEYPVTIRNYFEMNVWEVALEEFKSASTAGSSFNMFED